MIGAAGAAAAALVGSAAGLGFFAFDYGEGLSYFSTDQRACANCHVMGSQYDSWQKAGHHQASGCVDCHLPHDLLRGVQDLHRRGQWRLDFVHAENFMGFHADQETARLLGESIDAFRQAQLLAERLVLRAAIAEGAERPEAANPQSRP